MNTITASIILLGAGIAIGFAIYPNPTLPDPIHSDVIPREQAADDYSCGELDDKEHLRRVFLHARDAVPLSECGTAQRRTTAYLCGEINHEEWAQRAIFDDLDAVPLPECQAAGIVPKTPFWPKLLAWFFGRSKVGSFNQPKSLASTP